MLVKSDIIGILNEALGQNAKLRKGGNQATFRCPFCHHTKNKLEICLEESDKFSKWHCWACNSGGLSLGSLLKKLKSPSNLRTRLYNLTGDIRLVRRHRRNLKSDISLPDEFLPLSISHPGPEYRNAMSYLKSRHILFEDIIRYNIGFCQNGDYAQHIIIPSYDFKERLNFFIGRKYYQNENIISYKKPLNASMDIIGFEIFINWNEPLNICEGVFDACAIRNNAIPLFGKFLSKKLREAMILNGTKRVNMILDNDAMADAVKNCQMMTRLGIAVHLVCLDEKDPSVLGFEKIHNLIRNAKEFDAMDLLRYKSL